MTDKDKEAEKRRRNEAFEATGDPSNLELSASDPIRRVYALPQEMVDRIVEFQKEKGLPSEVEAVRRLLDEALKSRDNVTRIVNRFLAKLKSQRIASEVAKEVIVGHPLVTEMSFSADSVTFTLKDGWRINISDSGRVVPSASSFGGNKVTWKWLPKTPDRYGPGELDSDDIPF